jgi:hypothetical protein
VTEEAAEISLKRDELRIYVGGQTNKGGKQEKEVK